jgi:hypothetical protein
MARSVFVENHGSETYREVFRGRTIEIPSGSSIKMQRREAIAFLSTMSQPDPRNHGNPIEKKLSITPDENDKTPDVEEFVCHLDNRKFSTKAALNKHLKKLEAYLVEKDVDGNIKKKVV